MRKLSSKLEYWRAERPDEWTMDEFIRDARAMEGALKALLALHDSEVYVAEPWETTFEEVRGLVGAGNVR